MGLGFKSLGGLGKFGSYGSGLMVTSLDPSRLRQDVKSASSEPKL